jgi:hypothetical protein
VGINFYIEKMSRQKYFALSVILKCHSLVLGGTGFVRAVGAGTICDKS